MIQKLFHGPLSWSIFHYSSLNMKKLFTMSPLSPCWSYEEKLFHCCFCSAIAVSSLTRHEFLPELMKGWCW